MNPFDELSVEESVRIREKKRYAGGVDDICVISAGPAKAADVLRTAMAMGADRAIHVETAEGEELEPLAVAKLLRAAVEREKSNLVVLGKQSIDDDAAQTGPMLAGLLGWAQATQASAVAFDGDAVLVTKEVDGGAETVRAKLPLVITTDLRLNEPRYASLPNIMKAKKKPLVKMSLSDLGVANERRLKVVKVTGTFSFSSFPLPFFGDGLVGSWWSFLRWDADRQADAATFLCRTCAPARRRQGRGRQRLSLQAQGAGCPLDSRYRLLHIFIQEPLLLHSRRRRIATCLGQTGCLDP